MPLKCVILKCSPLLEHQRCRDASGGAPSCACLGVQWKRRSGASLRPPGESGELEAQGGRAGKRGCTGELCNPALDVGELVLTAGVGDLRHKLSLFLSCQ